MTLEKLVVIIQAETASLEKGINRVKSQLSSLERTADRVSGRLSGAFNNASSGIGKAIKALSLGALLAGLANFGYKAIQSASDLQEWSNVVDVAFHGATEDVEMFNRMAVDRFGLSEIAAKKLTGTFMAMANGIGLSDAAGRKMSIQLAGLSADMASFFNTTTESTSNALEGIFTGQTRALKQYGVVMNEANLEAFRMSRGIQTAYSNMSTAQQVALRYNYVLAATANAQNDFARTSMSWANQMRQLQMNWASLTSTVGRQLIGILTPVVAILNKILKLAISVINAIAKIFGGQGISGLSTSIGDAGAAAGGLADNIGDVGDGLGGATAAAKKFKATIAGFDELEVLNSQPTSGGGGGGGGGAGGGGGGPSSEDIDSYFDLYDEEGILNNFEDFFQKIKDMMDADNWEGVGAEIAKGLNYVFKAVDDWITNVFEPFGVLWAGRIARVLNGLVDELDWDLIGKTFADGLNAYIHIANEFYEKFNSLNFAIGIATAVNSWFHNVDWEGIGEYLANRLNFLGDILYGFATTIDWEQIKSSINNALTSLWENLDVVKIKSAIGKLVEDFVDFVESVDWYKIGYTIGEMFSDVDWLGVFKTVKDAMWEGIAGAWDGLMSEGKNFFVGTIGKISSWFKDSFWGPLAAAIGGGLFTVLKWDVIAGGLRGFFKDGQTGFTALIESTKYVWTNHIKGLGEDVLTQFAGFFKDWKKFGFGKAVSESIEVASVNSTGFAQVLSSLSGPIAVIIGLLTALSSAYGGLGGVLERVKTMFSDMIGIAKNIMDALGATSALQTAKEGFEKLAAGLKKVYDALAVLKPVWEALFSLIAGVGGVILGLIGTVLSGVIGLVGSIAGALGDIIGSVADFIKWIVDGISGLVQAVVDWFANLKYQLIGDPIVIDMWEGIKKVFSDAIQAVVDAVKGFIEKVIQFFTDLWNKAVEIYTQIKDFLAKTWEEIKAKTIELWNSLKQWLSQTWENLKQSITNTWNAIKEITTTVWNAIKSFISSIWDGIKSAVATAIDSIKTTVSNIWNSIKDTTSSIWNGIKKTVGDIWDGIKSKASSITGSIKGFFVDAYNGIKSVWDGFGGWFSGIFNGLSGIVRSAMNGVIGVLNGIGITVPSWVPEIGGRHFGFNIPYLAKGGIIESPTLAMMGEYAGARSNPEIVAPQSMIREIISEENGEMVSALYQIATQIINAIDGVDLSVSIGDDTIANAANRGNNAYKQRTGKPLFSM